MEIVELSQRVAGIDADVALHGDLDHLAAQLGHIGVDPGDALGQLHDLHVQLVQGQVGLPVAGAGRVGARLDGDHLIQVLVYLVLQRRDGGAHLVHLALRAGGRTHRQHQDDRQRPQHLPAHDVQPAGAEPRECRSHP